MSPPFRWFIGLALMAVGVIILLLVNGCADRTGESWDQDNLKRFDRGCPTAIYYGPEAKLCPTY